SRMLSVFCRTTPVPKVNFPRTTGSPGFNTGRCLENPGVFALATLFAEVSSDCWLTSRALRAVDSEPNSPDMISLLPAGARHYTPRSIRARRLARESLRGGRRWQGCVASVAAVNNGPASDDECAP